MTDRIAGRLSRSAAIAMLASLAGCGEGVPLSQGQTAATVQSTPAPTPAPAPAPTPAPTPTPVSVTLTATPSTVVSGGTVVLTWQSTDATSCSAAGAWSGAEPTSGSQTTGALTATSTYTLSCSGAAGTTLQSTTVAVTAATPGSATLNWSAPTDDTDGGALTPLAGYTIYYGTSPGSLTQFVPVADASVTSFTVTGLAAGTWYFGVQADALDGTHSALSNIGSKAL
jgi:hypothetical protein